MARRSDSRGRIGGAAKARFVEALRAGVKRDEAAAQAGFTSQGFYYARRRDAVFRFAWIWALELCAADQREARRAAALGRAAAGDPIAANNRRPAQRRRTVGIKFTAARKKLFRDHFAGTADVFASADAAGVHVSTVYKHRGIDPQFAQDWDEALRQSYALLEAEAVRQRLEAQRRLRESPEPTGEMAREFERVMALLARMDRRDGRIGTRSVGPGRQKRWTFEEAITALDKRLRALGLRHGIVPPDGEQSPDGGETS